MSALSNAMFEHLLALAKEVERPSYPGLSLGTLNALERRGYVASKRGTGSIAFPHTSIQWRITESGRAAVSSNS